MRAAGGVASAGESPEGHWVGAVVEQAGRDLAPIVTELSVTPLPEDREAQMGDYVAGLVRALVDRTMTRRVDDAKSGLRRLDPNDPRYAEAWARVVALENERRAWRESE